MLSAFISSVHSYPAMPLAGQLVHQRYVHPGPLVLRTAPFKSLTPATDRDRTVSRRSEPSSRAALVANSQTLGTEFSPRMRRADIEVPNLPVAVDAWGRSACYPQGSFLSVERWHFHSHTTGSLTPTFVTARPVGLAVRLVYAFTLNARFPSVLNEPLSASVTFLEATAPVKLPA